MNREIDALLEERHGYVVRGLADRVAQVDAELARLGYTRDDAAPARRERATKRPAEKRS